MSWDPVWEKIFREQSWGKYPPEELVRFIATNFYQAPDRKSVKILEVGCGPGANMWFLAREGFTVYGIDGSQTATERAKIRLDRECPGWEGGLVTGDIQHLPFENDFFDAVVDLEAVYANSWDDSRRIYAEMARVCKHDGKLFSKTFATGMSGDGTGQHVGPQAWIVGEGPMVGKGYTRFTGIEEIPGLIQGFRISGIELLCRTIENRRREIREWLIIGVKP